MTDSPNLALPYILPAQAQKHVTHNEAIRALDCIVQLSLKSRVLTAPPGSPAAGSRYLVAAGATGAWAGQSGRIAAFQDGAWAFYDAQNGWIAWIEAESTAVVYASGAWSALGPSGVTDHGLLTGLGDDDHPQYLTNGRGDARYDALGVASTGDAAHVAASDPHTQYQNNARGDARYQQLDGELTAIAGLTSAADKLPYFSGSGTAALADFTAAGRALVDDADAGAQRTTLGLGTAATQNTSAFDASGAATSAVSTHVAASDPHMQYLNTTRGDARYQPLDAELTAIAGLTSAADKLPYFSGSGTAVLAAFTSAGRALVDDADAAAQRTTLGLGTAATQNTGAFDASGAATSAVSTHVAASDPHTQYLNNTRGDARYTPINPTTLGINATADTTNRLALSSAASLFNNAGNGHQVKVNKNAASDTASFLFQTGYSGRAEIGTTGDDDFHFKVSSDGSTFYEAIKINKSSGDVTFPATGQVDVQRFTASGTWTKPAGAKSVRVFLTGGGGGGGGGGKAATGTAVSGGGGGGGAGRIDQVFDASAFGATETITVGPGGTGGTGATTNGPGGDGTAGGNSSFGSVVTAYGGGNGSGGNSATASAGGAGGSQRGVGGNASGATAGNVNASTYGTAGGSGASSAIGTIPTGGSGGGGCSAAGVGFNGQSAVSGGGGGASGGGVSSANAFQAGGLVNKSVNGNISGGATDGAAGTSGGTNTSIAGFGGSGGAGSVTSTGGVGGAGGAAGGGGGGGGGAQLGTGGAGGAGGRGEVLIITYR